MRKKLKTKIANVCLFFACFYKGGVVQYKKVEVKAGDEVWEGQFCAMSVIAPLMRTF